ncbi:hypothetical protein [Streptomyces osmaniensis]|uniref:hypothetical protein n=1 Tax=Streptomyces osmaniensis TaxID=593134 RepID=UPI0031FE05E6
MVDKTSARVGGLERRPSAVYAGASCGHPGPSPSSRRALSGLETVQGHAAAGPLDAGGTGEHTASARKR